MTSADCKGLEGKKDHSNFDEDLGPLCRLVVARNLASFRKLAPCVARDTLNPDWDPVIEDRYSLHQLNHLVSEAPLKRQRIPDPGVPRGGNNSTIFGTYVFDRGIAVDGKIDQFATYFCIAANPRRYVPYFYRLKNGDDVVIDDGAVVTPPDIPVLKQVTAFHDKRDLPVSLLADLDGDRVADVIVLRQEAPFSPRYYPAACLHNAKGADCLPVPDTAGRMAVDYPSPEFRMSLGKDHALLIHAENIGQKPVDVTFRWTDHQLKMIPERQR